MVVHHHGKVYSVDAEMLDVTSNHRPDETWVFVDAAGHPHFWTFKGERGRYRPDGAELPSLVWVKDGEAYWPDSDEPHDIGHYECRVCGEKVVPRYTADETTIYIKGLTSYRIDDELISRDEFIRRAKEDGLPI